MKKLINLFHKIKNGIINLIYWFPIIWNDRNWDTFYIYNILQFKLKRQYKALTSNKAISIHENLGRMKICIELIERLKTNYYETEAWDYLETKFEMEQIPGGKLKSLKVATIRDNLDDYFRLYKSDYRKAIKKILPNQTTSREQIAMYMEQIRHQKAKSLLFKLLDSRIEYWWD
jgi:hypothetical protein